MRRRAPTKVLRYVYDEENLDNQLVQATSSSDFTLTSSVSSASSVSSYSLDFDSASEPFFGSSSSTYTPFPSPIKANLTSLILDVAYVVTGDFSRAHAIDHF